MSRCPHYGRVVVAAMALALAPLAGCQQLDRLAGKWSNPLAKSPRRHASSKVVQPPLKLNSEQKADVEMAMALALEQNGQTDRAIKIYNDLIRKDRGHADAHRRLAILYDKNGECQKAEEHYRAVLKEEPQNAEAYCNFGYSCYLQQRWTEAETNLRESLRLNPKSQRAHNNLGLVLARTECFDEANEEFRRAGCAPADAHANLAFALMFDDRWDEAQRQFEFALAADSSSKAASEGLRAIQSLAGPGRQAHRGAAGKFGVQKNGYF